MALAVLMAMAAVLRLSLTYRYYRIPDADQSVLGLMARHVLLGERPVFYWGQVYTGSGEAYLTAMVFRLFGQSDFALHLAPLACSVGFCIVTCLLARRLYGGGIAVLTAIYLAFCPAFLVLWSGWAGSGYLEAMMLGTAALLLGLPGDDRALPELLPLLCAFSLLGLAIWTQPIALYYLAGLLAGYAGPVLRILRTPGLRPALLLALVSCVGALCLGAAPLVVFNLQHQGATISFLTARAPHVSVLSVLSRLVLWAGPVLLGFMPPSTDRAYFLHFTLDHYGLYGVALILLLMLLFRGLSRWRALLAGFRSRSGVRRSGDMALLALAVMVAAGYLATGWGGEEWAGTQPRYLLPAYSVLPLVLRAALPSRPVRWQWVAAGIVVSSVAAANLYVASSTEPRRDLAPLVSLLERHGIRAVYGDYWTVYPLMFESSERLTGVAVNDDLGKGILSNRYSPYLRAAAATADYAWVATAGSERDRSIQRCLARLHSRTAVVIWQDQTIYLRPGKRAFPWWNGGRC